MTVGVTESEQLLDSLGRNARHIGSQRTHEALQRVERGFSADGPFSPVVAIDSEQPFRCR